MKILKRKSLYGSIIVMIILCIGIQAYAVNGNDEESEVEISAVSEFIEEEYVSEEFITYLENGSTSAEMPAMQDYTYLAESYANLASTQNSGLLPSSYDLRTEGLVTPVVNQESLNVCWAIAASEALTSSIIEQFPQESISSLPLAYFTYTNEDVLEFFGREYDPYMDGGNGMFAIATLANWNGPILNSTYFSDYAAGEDVSEEYRDDAEYHLQDAYYMPVSLLFDIAEDDLSGSIEVIQSLIYEGLPVTMNFASFKEESYYNEETYAYNNSELNYVDHGVLIIGWDDNYSKDNFPEEAQPENDGAWLIQNSWGTSWGDEGCFWLSYEDPTIYIGAVYVLEEADNYTTNYGYDIAGWHYSVATSTDNATIATAANIFTAESDEQLEAVSFYTTDTSVSYTISVYTDLRDATDPTSGDQQLVEQTGTEAYAGYHTIELDETIALTDEELFSIVVTFENSTYDAPLPVELYILNEDKTEPNYLGNGDESYVLIGEEWEDIAGKSESLTDLLEMEVYITNVCIKAFTNPLPSLGEAVSTVTFSEMEGPIASGTTIILEADDGETIYYTVNGGTAVKGDEIEVKFSDTVSKYEIAAYAVDADGYVGNIRTKTYTQASAQLVNLAVDSGITSTYLETDADGYGETQSVTINSSMSSTQIMAQSSDTITITMVADDGTKTEIGWESDGLWSEEIPITEGEVNLLEVVVSGEGKTSTTYTIEITKGAIEVDWVKETITYDDTQYKVTDKDGNEIASGGSVNYLITTTDTTILTVKNLDTGATFTEELPVRSDLSGLEAINYEAETTVAAFSDTCYYSTNEDMSEATQCVYGECVALTPGEDMYIQRFAVEGLSFASDIIHIEVPDRPTAPVIEVAEQTSSTLTVVEIEGAIYRIDEGDWQYDTEFTGLTEEATYKIEAVLLATDSAFASEVGSLNVATLSSSDSSDETSDDETSSYTDGTITITGDIEESVSLYVTELLESDEGYSLLLEEAGDDEIIWLKEISLRYEDGTVCSYNGTLKLRISVPEVEDTSNLVLLHYTADGTIEKLVNETTDAGYFETTLTSLSPFALINTTSDDIVTQTTTTSGTAAGDSEADTGDDTSALQWVILLSIALIGVCGLVFYIIRKKKEE